MEDFKNEMEDNLPYLIPHMAFTEKYKSIQTVTIKNTWKRLAVNYLFAN